MQTKVDNQIYKCNFCGKPIDENKVAFRGIDTDNDTIYICQDCVELCHGSLENSLHISDDSDNIECTQLKKPSEIKAYLDEYVIGQDHAKDILSVAVYNHYKMLYAAEDKNNDIDISKSNILMIGSTGSGKTLLLQTLAKFLDVPLVIVDCSTLTAAGFVGSDVETSLKLLIQEADGDIEKAERGIVFLDEFDKLGRKGENVSITRDVGGEAVQQGLLKMIEGAIVEVPQGQRKHPQEECLKINTKNILFVCGGSFEGIEKIIQKRINTNDSPIGFGATPQKHNDVKLGDVIDQVNTDDLRKFGLIPEIIGRLPVICTLHDLDKYALIKIMKEPKNALCKQYSKLLEYDGVKLTFDDSALEEIAKIAIEKRTGARGLRNILETMLLKYMKICPEGNIKSINITPKYVTGKKEEPDIEYNNLDQAAEA